MNKSLLTAIFNIIYLLILGFPINNSLEIISINLFVSISVHTVLGIVDLNYIQSRIKRQLTLKYLHLIPLFFEKLSRT